MKLLNFETLEPRYFYLLVGLGALLTLVGLGAAHHMETHGHVVTGMDNQIVWGMPHVFAIFMIIAASGVLNVASIGSVFGKTLYKPRAPLSGLLALTLLAGGLMVLMLDLGRPERFVIAATHYNFTSVFAWNVFLYSGFFAIVGFYLWCLMDPAMKNLAKKAGLLAFIWRFILTTGTGSIFAFLVARQAYQSAILAPMFIVLSFAWGLAIFLLVQSCMFAWNGVKLHPHIHQRLARLLGIFIAAGLFFAAVYHVTNLYYARQADFTRFILLDGDVFPGLFWLVYVLIGGALPMLLLFLGQRSTYKTLLAALATILGAFAHLYVFIIGGQSFPLNIFPGFDITSTFADGAISYYSPSVFEILLGVGGLALAFTATTIGVRVLRFLPEDDLKGLQAAVDTAEATQAN